MRKSPRNTRCAARSIRPQSFTMPMSITAGMLDAIVPPQSVIQLANTVKNTNPVNPNVVSFVRADRRPQHQLRR